ncbi:HAMP domain-containing histidine kinase [Candidatus Bipolaricaulota bacterium]|nr:HAMP domain-containing histidine kinase [Candidatus Bipolaricaulota bacterium]
MRRTFPFALKLGLAFVLVIFVSVATGYFFNLRSISVQFAEFREHDKMQVAEEVCAILGEHYRLYGSWVGVDERLKTTVNIRANGQIIDVQEISIIPGSFSLTNEDGVVFISTDSARLGTLLSAEEVQGAIPIEVDGVRVGVLSLGELGTLLDPAEEQFVASAQRSALLGGGIASGMALLIALVLISQVLSPLRILSRATEKIAQGELPEPVELRASDEFGRLGALFNRMIENLDRSENARQTMTADVAHELRTPVTIIQGNLEAILDGIYEPTVEAIAPIYEETLHVGQLIDDLRDLALAEAGELSISCVPTDLRELVDQVAETVSGSLEQGPRILVSGNTKLPKVKLDPKRIRQVLVNLLSNAVRVTPLDGRIDIRLTRIDSDLVELSVTDSGPGIPKEDLPHIFERLYRGDRARSRAQGGSGLGLAIARHWVEAHGGTITAENVPGAGACFRVRFHVPLS